MINTGLTGSNTTWEGTIINNTANTVTASNGLNISGNDVKLGGTLSQATTITNNGNNLNIAGSIFGTTFTSSGNVGIGTTAPVSRFHLSSPDFGVYNGLRIEDTEGANASIFTITPGYLHNVPCGTCVTFDYAGEGYIGFTDHIVPSIDGIFSVGASTNRWSAVYAVNGTIQTSDLRLKKDIENTRYGLASVMKMRPVEYNWKDGKGKHMVGFIAQEMEKIVPEAVETPTSKDEYYGMNYNQIIPVLTKAIQEQQALIEKQQAENENLKMQIQEIKKQIDLLQKK
ncbi:tail fiber domain-containing protein [Chryseobacterium gossypii]|uniref:tail fiber domain-containing protein n=1 Tax=Chryseobacterium gossypii TaxID=3231602 RepID=UPI003525D7FD